MTKLESFHIDEFANGEHRGLQIDDLDGDSLLLRGGTRTGKTLTFNALLYGLLGASETISLATGRQNRVELNFTDGTRFFRGNPQAVFDDGETEYESGEAIDQLEDKLSNEDLVKSHFVHSHIGKMPLDNLSKSKRISLIRSLTNQGLEKQLERHRDAADQLQNLVIETRDEKRRIEEQLSEVERQINDLGSQQEKYEDLLEKAESGTLQRIREQLIAEEEVEEELDKLFKKKEGIRKRLRKLHRQKRKQENYSSEVRTIIAEAVNDFVCPTCDRRITTEKAERRLKRNICPFCGQDHSLDDLKNQLEDKIDRSDEILETLNDEIDELQTERDNLTQEINRLQEEQPELKNLDGFTKRRLDSNNYDIEEVKEDANEELDSILSSLDDLQQKKTELQDRLDETETKLEEYSEASTHASDQVEELEDRSFEQEIQEFTDAWEDTYMEISGDIGLEINVTRNGEIQLPGRNSIREYDSGGNLSGSEIRLLNLSFACALSRVAEGEVWQTLVFDEPFDNLNDDTTQEALEYIQDADQQFIITTSDEALDDHFDNVRTMESEPIQTQLGDFL